MLAARLSLLRPSIPSSALRAAFSTSSATHAAQGSATGAPSKTAPQPQLFNQTVILTDGSSITVRTTSPRQLVQLTKDTRNHPLWHPEMEVGLDDESGRILRFAQRFGDMEEMANMGLFDEEEEPTFTPSPPKKKN